MITAEKTKETPGSTATSSTARVAGLAAERLEAEVVDLAGRLSAGTFELLVLVGELDARGLWARWGALSCAAWLADICDVEVATARTQVRVARAMCEHPALHSAMADGDVSYAKARVLVPHLTTANAHALLRLAATNPAGRLGAAIAAWSQQHEDPEDIARRQHQERNVSWRTGGDGMVTITTRVPPATAGAICAAIDAQVTRADAPAGASLGQQRADALLHIVTHGGADVDAEVVFHVRGDGTTLADGTPVSDDVVAGLLPEAFVSVLVLDSERRPIDASPRRRTPTRRQRRVLDEAQTQCAHPGCTARTFLQYDHIEPYARGGPTVLANLQRLCGPHNRARTGPSNGG